MAVNVAVFVVIVKQSKCLHTKFQIPQINSLFCCVSKPKKHLTCTNSRQRKISIFKNHCWTKSIFISLLWLCRKNPEKLKITFGMNLILVFYRIGLGFLKTAYSFVKKPCICSRIKYWKVRFACCASLYGILSPTTQKRSCP